MESINKYILINIFLFLSIGNLAGQDPLWKQASDYEKTGNYTEAIRLKKLIAKEDIGTEWYIDDIAGIARCYSNMSENDSTIKYCNLTIHLAEDLINHSDSIAEEYIQSTAWSLYRCGEYDKAFNSANKVLDLREKIHGKFSAKYLEWLGVMSYNALCSYDLLGIRNLCEQEINITESGWGINSKQYGEAVSSIRAYAHQLVDKYPLFVIEWITPYNQKLKESNILIPYQIEFDILLLEANLSQNDLQSADKIAHSLEQWTYDSYSNDIPLDDQIRIWLKLANYDRFMGDHYKARWRIMECDKKLENANRSLNLTQLIDRHIVELNLRMDTLGCPRINAEWLINTSTPIINAGTEDDGVIAFFYASRAWGYEEVGEYDKAIDDIKRAILLNPLYSYRKKLAQFYLDKRDFVNAESELLSLYNDKDVPQVGLESVESDLMSLYWMWGQKEKLIIFAQKDYATLLKDIRRAFAFMNENERENFVSQSLIGSSIYFDIYTSFSDKLNQWGIGNEMAYNLALTQKGLLLSTTKDIESILEELPDSLIPTYNSYKKYKELEPSGIDIESSLSRNIRMELMSFVSQHPTFLSQLDITWKQVRDRLSEHESAIEFITINGMSPENIDSLNSENVSLAAIIVRSKDEYPICVKLGQIKDIEALYELDENGERIKDGIYLENNRQKAYKLIWDPITQYLDNIKTIYYSPTGILQEINLDFIGNNDLLCNQYNLYRLSSTRELCNGEKTKNNNAILYGDIAYSNNQAISDYLPTSKYRSISRAGFGSLSGTLNEINTIQSYLTDVNIPNSVFVRNGATEESFRLLSGNSPHIIHLATHGFYYTKDAAGQQYLNPNFIAFQTANSELHRSGLALSGAQDSWMVNDIETYLKQNQDNDGILLSSEIANLDLRGTDLVVLSACETALGNVTSEGVYGLQRAFKLAGVNSIIMSLWKVDDDATQLIMNMFYQHFLNGESKHDSLVKAQIALKETPGFEDPYYWAAFILLDALN